MALVTEVVCQLNLERPFDQSLGQLRKQTAGPDDLLLCLRADQQLVDNVVRQLASDLIRHALKDPRRLRRRLAERLAAGATGTRETRSIERLPTSR